MKGKRRKWSTVLNIANKPSKIRTKNLFLDLAKKGSLITLTKATMLERLER